MMRGRLWQPSKPTVMMGVFAALVVLMIAPVQAQASFNSQVSQSMGVGSATLQPPTGVTLTAACGSTLATSPAMTASWTASASTFATGYTIVPYLNGAAQTAVTATAGATSKVVTMDRNTLTTYHYWTFTIYANFNNSWTSSVVSPTPASVNCPFLSI